VTDDIYPVSLENIADRAVEVAEVGFLDWDLQLGSGLRLIFEA
jgi:hypothetical protein